MEGGLWIVNLGGRECGVQALILFGSYAWLYLRIRFMFFHLS